MAAGKAGPIALLVALAAAGAFVAGRQSASVPGPAPSPGAPRLAAPAAPAAPVAVEAANIRVCFSPRGGCTDAIVAELDKARESVLIQAYSFTSDRIAKAAVEAQRRGVKVRAVLDKSQRSEKFSELDFLARAGIPTRVDSRHAIAHNKVMVIDGETVITGSFNFTKAAEERNAENLLIIRDKKLAELYAASWREHEEHSEAYAAK
ncbi:MAG TPA: phospholipase D family protein [Planctomycetota bacterium]|nr:phospholipase D family protein [Planctomycetota bacterium]